MADVLRIKRRASGLPGAPASLQNAELAYNEVDNILYYGVGTGGAGGTASSIAAIAGQGLAYTLAPAMNGAAAAGAATSWARGDHVHPSDTSRAPLANPSFTGTVTINGTITGPGMTAWAASPPPIGATTPAAGAFTSLSASGLVSGAGFAALHAAPGPIGGTTPGSGAFTTLSASGVVSGAGFTGWAASPPPIGATTPGSGAFTTLSASGTVSGAGFATWAASPPPIGGTAPAAGSFTNLAVSGALTGAGVTGLLAGYAPLASPVFTGAPSLPIGAVGVTQANGTNSTQLATTAYVLAVRLNQLAAPTGAVSLNGQPVTNVLNPVNPQDAATKSYVDQNSAGLSAKGAAAVATTGANLVLSGLQTIDGYTTIAGDRVLVKDQTLQQNNGIYVAATGAWARAADMATWAQVPQAYVFVSQGAVNSASSWVCNAIAGGALGTTPITWVQFSQQAQVTAGAGLVRTGNNFDVIGTAGRIAVLADSLDIDAGYAGQTSITVLGAIATGTWNGSTIQVARGGSGATNLTGYLKGNGVNPFTASASIPSTDITGLGSMAAQNAAAVAITGGTIDGITFDMGSF